MTQALVSGVDTRVSIAEEITWGVKPAAGTAKEMRRTSLTANLSRQNFQSAEISSYAQTMDSRNGTDNLGGSLAGELSAGTHADIYAAITRGSWVAGSTVTAATIAGAAGKFVRSAGSWITDGFKVGDLVQVSGFTGVGLANNGYWLVLNVTTTDLTVAETEDKTVAVAAAGDSVTVAVDGKKLQIPLTPSGRTDKSFTIEQFYVPQDNAILSTGVKFGNAAISVAPNQMSTVSFDLMGRTQEAQTGAYFTSPAAASTSSTMSGSRGAIVVDGVVSGVVTGYNFTVNGNMEQSLVVGKRQAADISLGRITVDGSLTAFFDDVTIFNQFTDETDISLVFWNEGDAGENLVFKFPRVKLNSADRDDKEVGNLIQTVNFTALLPKTAGTITEQSTIVIQDTTL